MRKRGIPKEYTEWMRRCLKNRSTSIFFDNYDTETFTVKNGLDQGDPFSGICYLLYNAGLLKVYIIRDSELTLLYVDDALIIIIGKNFQETHNKI